MSYRVTLIPGDGVGPEVVEAAKICIEASGVEIIWEEKLLGAQAQEKLGSLIPEETLASIRKNKLALKGPVTTPVGKGFRSVNVGLRKALDLYANVRPAKSLGACNSKYDNVDIVVVRENTEDLYAGIEFDFNDPFASFLIDKINKGNIGKLSENTAISFKTISKKASERIIRFAFEYAIQNKRKKLACVHKANILKFTDGLFLSIFYEIAKDYKEIEAQDYIVDNLSMQLVLRPYNFDVLVLPNLYGDIISDLCAGLIGGLGLAPGANIGQTIAVFEPVHGSAPKYTGKNKVNPAATILSAALLLKHLQENEAARKIEQAVKDVIKENKSVTYDLKLNRDDPSSVGTLEMAEAIADKIKSY
ncbi:MAG: isocitrate/isopropylmalate dehydrogenase family protein [Candidatus Omnitrophica bacterium]|nr:isocitrate/isopropylmalate dehydrogenase family protein [Candidatus Omnitrophota bacterium]